MLAKKNILITGCSSGIGYEAALKLHQRGHHVIASCRREEDATQLKAHGLEVVILDVNDSASIQRGFQQMLALTDGRLDVLINNAGYGQAGALEDISREVLRQQFETNVFGLLELTNLAIPLMRQQGQGRIINISSILGIISMPFRGAYNASKYAVEGLSDTLRLELAGAGIKVITIEPGPIESKFRDSSVDRSLQHIAMESSFFKPQYQKMLAVFKASKKDSVFTLKPAAVIKKLIHAIEAEKPKAKYAVTFPAHLFVWLKRFLPTCLLDKVFLFLSKQELS